MENQIRTEYTFELLAIGGHNSWSNLVRLSDMSETYALTMDHANDGNNDKDKASLEAVIRRTWSDNPNCKLALIESPSWILQDIGVDSNVDHPTTEAQINNMRALAVHYGIPVIAYWVWCKTVVNGGTYHLNQITEDTVHPSTLGYTNMATLALDVMPNGGASAPSPLPDRLYDNGDYENTPTRTLGTNYDSRTGTGWTDTGTRTESSTEGDTITFSATCHSIGAYRTDTGSNVNLEISVDGGAYRDASVTHGGLELVEGRGAHTITIRLKASGSIRVDEFWAI